MLAGRQLGNTGITLFKERLPETPSIVEWLGCVLNAEDNVGIDGWVNEEWRQAAIATGNAKWMSGINVVKAR